MAYPVMWEREVSNSGASRSLSRWFERRRQHRHDEDRVSRLVHRFLATAAGSDLARDTESCAGLPGIATPQVVSVRLGHTDRLLVRMMSGQIPADYVKVRQRLAEGLGVPSVRIRPRSEGYVWIELHRQDPLGQPVSDIGSVPTDRHIVLGRTDDNELLSVLLEAIQHIVIQGQTGSGKSRFTYKLLTQLAGRPDVRISGSDVTGILFRPFQGTRHHEHLALGSSKPEEHAEVLEALVAEMDDRIARMPERLDVFPCTSDDPYEVVVVEELPGLLKAANSFDAIHNTQRGAVKVAARIQAAYSRLLAEGRKVGFRVVIITQRADASIIGGGFERGQLTLRISFPVDTPEAVKMLHPTVDPITAEQHVIAPAGRALVSGPGLPLTRMRSPEMGDYGAFLDEIAEVAGPSPDRSTEE